MPETDLTPEEEVPASAIVLRFRPSAPDAVLRSAEAAHAHAGSDEDRRFFCSVFVDVEADNPESSDVIAGLLEAASLSGIQPPPVNKYYFVTRAQELLDRGFQFKKDRYDGEVAKHYSVSLGADPSLEDAERFVEAFDTEGGKSPWLA